MKQFLSALTFTLFTISTSTFALDSCPTHFICPTNTNCNCTVSADAFYSRYFYIDFATIQKGHQYECQLKSNIDTLSLVLNASTLPAGSQITHCTHGCLWFPIKLQLDTTKMDKNEDTLILKYSVIASDIPSGINVSCHLKK